MAEDVSLYKHTVLAAFQCQCVTPIGIHKDKLGVLLLVEVAVLVHKLIVILVEVFTEMFACFVCLSLVMVELLIRFG